MFISNTHPDYNTPLEAADVETLGPVATDRVERVLARRENHTPTPLHALPALARELGLGAIQVKDESVRLGLGSFKALGGAYAVIVLVLQEAAKRLSRPVDVAELHTPDVRSIAAGMTFACATDGNHGRSVAQGTKFVGAKSVIFVHSGVSEERIAAIAQFGAEMVRVDGNYDDSVVEAARVATDKGWEIVSDTSWPGYERIPGLVMQGYTVMVREALAQMGRPPTHVFVQSGVGGVAAAVAGHLAVLLGNERPIFIVVDPARAACLYESAKANKPVKIAHGEPTVMAMLECYEPSLVAWRILSHVADGFMIVDEEDAIAVMRRLARPAGRDPAIVAGESGGVGLAGLIKACKTRELCDKLGLGTAARVWVINTEGATDAARYQALVGLSPAEVLARRAR
ncbi:diaminopropionate ammonia-lyase [Bradyrhizobium sp. LHD-71]|uniref:diaminopropionate ammonia-lyase n=1 Tax=Bradyrhizobium sp. LHD-71 TaxID=3072141 RepID=UPI00280D6B2E|nr:diaminopropionate ammonia-lyase [Bradyrhizobium sp. LHD-71]MDQ8726861.1 diaminopropionate ammonia-lyase [Bradyrhizobium sp. LHD-71]